MKLDGMETDSRAHVSVLTNRLELLLAEKTAADEVSREQRLRLAGDRLSLFPLLKTINTLSQHTLSTHSFNQPSPPTL